MKQPMSITILLALMFLLMASGVHAEEWTCRRSLGAVTVDNLRVPAGTRCTLNGTRIQGTIVVERGATLIASRISVVGNIQAENAALVDVRANSRIGGSIQIVHSRAARIVNSRISGDLQFESNSRRLVAQSNVIGGSLQAIQNSGGLVITANRIDGNLQCSANRPAPTGRRNIVQGNKEDQCARL